MQQTALEYLKGLLTNGLVFTNTPNVVDYETLKRKCVIYVDYDIHVTVKMYYNGPNIKELEISINDTDKFTQGNMVTLNLYTGDGTKSIFKQYYTKQQFGNFYQQIDIRYPQDPDFYANKMYIKYVNSNTLSINYSEPMPGGTGKRITKAVAWKSTGHRVPVRVRDKATGKVKVVQKTLYRNVTTGATKVKCIRNGKVTYVQQ
jgi:hypothetical protein